MPIPSAASKPRPVVLPRPRVEQPAPPPRAATPASTRAADSFQPVAGPAAPVRESPGAAAAASRSVELGREIAANYHSDIRAGGHDGVRRELRTYQVGQPIRMAWPNHPGGSGGNVASTRCNVLAYNVAYHAGLALPTQHYARRSGPPLSDVLAPAELAGPLRNPNARDPRDVRSYFQRVEDPSQARAGDWVLYHHPPDAQHPHGHWGHVDVVREAPVSRADGDVELHTLGAGGNAQRNREVYDQGSVRIGAGETVHGSRDFDRAMVIRPMRTRPAGDTDPNAAE